MNSSWRFACSVLQKSPVQRSAMQRSSRGRRKAHYSVHAAISARAFRRITCGGCPKARRKARRMRSRSAKPVCRAITSIGWRLCSIIRRAASTRRFSTALAGDWPVSAWNARLNWRGLRCAASASCRTVSSLSRLRFAYSNARWIRSDLGSSSSNAENCDWPPARR